MLLGLHQRPPLVMSLFSYSGSVGLLQKKNQTRRTRNEGLFIQNLNDPLLFDVCHAVNNFTTLSFRFLAKAIEQFLERRPFSR